MSDDQPIPVARPIERRSVTQRLVERWDAAPDAGTAVAPALAGSAGATQDAIAVEEPLEIRIAGDSLATIMRTPGEDHLLVAGFLFTEGIITSLADLGRVAHCGRPSATGYGNLVDVAPGPGTSLAPELAQHSRRNNLVGSACGVCGRERVDDLIDRLGRVRDEPHIRAALIARSVEQLQARQAGFARTGAMHGALALSSDGTELAAGEDVGRHNAVDKVIGKLLHAGQIGPQREHAALLVVSGRASFEIVQKAAAARIGMVVSVSAPTSLAVDLAVRTGITLAGFARGAKFNVYSHSQRIIVDYK